MKVHSDINNLVLAGVQNVNSLAKGKIGKKTPCFWEIQSCWREGCGDDRCAGLQRTAGFCWSSHVADGIRSPLSLSRDKNLFLWSITFPSLETILLLGGRMAGGMSLWGNVWVRQAASVGSAWAPFPFYENSESDCLPRVWGRSVEGDGYIEARFTRHRVTWLEVRDNYWEFPGVWGSSMYRRNAHRTLAP